jgi:DNA-binding GntR family transcriptional regulator
MNNTKIDNKGSFVANLTVENVEDLYAVRKQLEPFAAGLAYGHMKQGDYEELATIFHQMKACTEGRDYRGLSMAEAAFHRAIWGLSGNKVLERTLNSVCPPLFAFVFVDVVTYDPQIALEEHGALLEALKRGGADDVRRTFEEKMEIFRMRDVKNVRARYNPKEPKFLETGSAVPGHRSLCSLGPNPGNSQILEAVSLSCTSPGLGLSIAKTAREVIL